jgi:DNA-binding response OmpR family regulator
MARICRVLVVEDHGGIRAIIGDALDKHGYRFTLLASGQGAWKVIEAENHDLAIIDVPLANEDAVALARLARDAGMGVILTTAKHETLDVVQPLAYRQLRKPFKLEPLLQLIDAILRDLANRCVRRKSRGSPVGSISRA